MGVVGGAKVGVFLARENDISCSARCLLIIDKCFVLTRDIYS